MKTWNVKSKGRIERIIIFYFFLSSIIVSFLLYAFRRNRIDIVSVNSDELFPLLLTFAPIWIPLLVVTLNKLLRARIPKEITFSDQKTLIIRYNKREHEFIPFENLAYSHSDLTKNHISLTFYKTFVGSRGQVVYNEKIQMIGMRWTLSWTTEQIKEVIGHLKQLEIERKKSNNENLSLFDKISS